MPEAFALVYEAAKRTLGLTPFDVQIIAAAAMQEGRVIELPTGEGKTLVAVFTAYLGALSGKGVHVLTFNDYLARRDAEWMGPIYKFLGMSVGYIQDGMDKVDRKKGYAADVTYVTAKESGFDYLRTFLGYDIGSLVHRPFNLAIIDEADSLLIDEARIPLVIAGDIAVAVDIDKELYDMVRTLSPGLHYETDEYANNIAITEDGITRMEEILNCGNLFAEENLSTLAKINIILQAEVLLKKDVDYIIRNGEIELVDEFTGRVVKNRQWPDGLHAAVEVKEGLISKSRGMVMDSITLQNFLMLYPRICGMTGTAAPAAPELFDFYDLSVTVIPPHRTCIRVDHDDMVFTHKQAKYNAVVEEIKRVHNVGRPILVGTCSVEESELISNKVNEYGIKCQVLNAKNDEYEAQIIADAGRLSAVTISTNMAGRGVDIRLGGNNSEEYDKVASLGGLYVIGTNRHDSVRIDNQLKGRSGRQGDPGESRLYISLEDDLIMKYKIQEVLPEEFQKLRQEETINDVKVNKAILHTQKIIEGQSFEQKKTLMKYASVVEDQRKIVHEKRVDILTGKLMLSFLKDKLPKQYQRLLLVVGEEELIRAEREIGLYVLNKCWADYLLFVENITEGVHLVSIAKGDPVLNFNVTIIEGFDKFQQQIEDEMISALEALVIKDGRIDLDMMGIKGPSSTRTYMVTDGSDDLGMIEAVGQLVAKMFTAPFYLGAVLLERMFKKK